MVKICPNCNSPVIDEQSQFCTKCGSPLITKITNPTNEINNYLEIIEYERIEPYLKQYWKIKAIKEKYQLFRVTNPDILDAMDKDFDFDDIIENHRDMYQKGIELKRNLRDIEKIREINLELDDLKKFILFLEDISKFQKLLSNKGIQCERSSLFFILINALHDEIIERVKIEISPYISKIPTDASIPIDIVLAEILSIYINKDISEENIGDDEGCTAALLSLSRILKKYGYIVSTEEIQKHCQKIIHNTVESLEIKQFEKELFSESNTFVNVSQESSNVISIDNLSGFEFEQLLERLFETCKYDVILTKKTGDQGADLVISNDQEVIVIQAKCYSNQPVGNKAIQEIVAAKKYYKGDKALVIATTTFTKSAIELAEANDVELWDGKILQSKLEEVF